MFLLTSLIYQAPNSYQQKQVLAWLSYLQDEKLISCQFSCFYLHTKYLNFDYSTLFTSSSYFPTLPVTIKQFFPKFILPTHLIKIGYNHSKPFLVFSLNFVVLISNYYFPLLNPCKIFSIYLPYLLRPIYLNTKVIIFIKYHYNSPTTLLFHF